MVLVDRDAIQVRIWCNGILTHEFELQESLSDFIEKLQYRDNGCFTIFTDEFKRISVRNDVITNMMVDVKSRASKS